MTTNPEPDDLDDPALRDRAVAAALGAAPFDLLLNGAEIACMVTGRLRRADVGLVGPLIASVHPPASRQDAAERVALDGRIVAPGLIDTHLHIESSMVTPRRYAETVVPQGTTTICWDPHELGNVHGLDGVRWAAAESRDLPLRILLLAPSCVPSAPGLERAGAAFGPDELREMLSWPEIAGIAEIMDMRGVLAREPRMRGIMQAALASGKLVCGHARDLRGAELIAFAASGIASDHEIGSGEDLIAKLEAGFTIELRGSHDGVLPGAVAALRALPMIPQTLTLCTDDVLPDRLVAQGGMIDLIRRLVARGLDPLQALRAATLNAAQRIGRRDLGLVAPGRRADLIVLSDLHALRVERVYASGRLAGQDGVSPAPPRAARMPPPAPSVRLAPLDAGDFRIRAPGDAGRARLRTIHTPRFTRWAETAAEVRGGVVLLPQEALLMAVVHRHGAADARPALGVLQGWGAWRGALATTVSHDSHNLTVFGRDAHDMALAANALIRCGGGLAVVSGGVLRALLELPLGGLISDRPTAEVAEAFSVLREEAGRIADFADAVLPFRSVTGASLACNPGPHLTDLGVTDGSTGTVFADSVIAFEAAL